MKLLNTLGIPDEPGGFRHSTFLALVAILCVSMVVTVALALAKPPHGNLIFQNYIFLVTAAMLAIGLKSGDRLLLRLLCCSTVMGVVELAADWWLVAGGANVLHYPPEPTNIVCSPLYMPLLWATLPLCLCYGVAAFIPRWGRVTMALVAGVAGFGLGVFWESLTFYFNAWQYDTWPPMVGKAPLFIVMGEVTFLPALSLYVYSVSRRSGGGWLYPALGGVGLGLFIWINYVGWYYLL